MTSIEQLSTPRATAPANVSQATAVEQARAVAEVAAAVRVARDFPRDEAEAYRRMEASCSTQTMADRAFYSLPRRGAAGGKIEGESVHLARELAGCWGNLDYGIRELRRDDDAGESEMQAWAWDQQANVRSSRSFIVPHARMVGSEKRGDKRRERLTDLGDIANNNNSVAARAVRETIFTVLPTPFVVAAIDICNAVLRGHGPGQRVTDPDQVKAEGIAYFRDQFGVTQGQLEDRIGAPANDWTPANVAYLRVLSGELTRGEKRVADEFPVQRVTAADTVREQLDAPAGVDTTTGELDPTTEPGFGGQG